MGLGPASLSSHRFRAVVIGPTVSPYPEPRDQRIHDDYIGRHDMFYEPPPGYYARNTFGMMKAKTDPHRFTLYRTDFLPGTTRLSPQGAMRFNLMASRLPGWLGPVVVEWSPDEPGMAEARRNAVLATLAATGQPVVPERVIIGPSIYPGTFGTDGANYYNVMITRDTAAPQSWSLSPASNWGSEAVGVAVAVVREGPDMIVPALLRRRPGPRRESVLLGSPRFLRRGRGRSSTSCRSLSADVLR